jgi:hypothetical protein
VFGLLTKSSHVFRNNGSQALHPPDSQRLAQTAEGFGLWESPCHFTALLLPTLTQRLRHELRTRK